MQTKILETLIALVFTGIIGGVIKVYLDYKSKLMENVWEKRLEAYMQFVRRTALLPKYPKKEVSWKEVYKLSTDFRDWYFEGHGLVTSAKFRLAYFSLQKHILNITKGRKDSEEKLGEAEYEELRHRCSKMRKLMADELESRESPIWKHLRKERDIEI